MKTFLAILLALQPAFGAGKLQNEDFKSRAQLEAAGGSQAQLLNDTKIYVTANGINSQLSTAISSGQIGGGGGGGVQFLANADFETGPTTSWTLGSGVSATADTTNYVGGKQSASLTLSSTNGDVISQDVTKAGSGINLEHTNWVKTALTTLQACSKQGSNEIQCLAVPSTDIWTPMTFNTVSPASGTVGIKIKSTSSTSGTVKVDTAYVGTARNLGTVAQAKNVVQFTWSGTLTASHDQDILFTWSGATQTRLQNFSHSSGVFTALAAGDYHIKFCPRLDYNSGSASTMRAITAKVYKNSTSTPLDASGYVHGLAQNNINGGGEPSSGFYANPPPCVNTTTSLVANDTLRFKAYQANGAGSNFSWLGGTLEINYFPSGSDQAVNPNVNPRYWYGTHGSDCAWTLTGITSFGTDYGGDATCTFATKSPSSGISCVSQTQSSNPSPGITCTYPKAGRYEVCATFVPYGTVATGHAHRLFDGTNTLAQMSEISNAEPGQVTLCGPSDVSGLTASYKIQSQGGSGNNILQSQRSPASAIEWSVKPLDEVGLAPVLVDSVTSNSAGAERSERAKISVSNTSAAILSQSGSWLSVSNGPSAGRTNITMSGFSAEPTCTCTTNESLKACSVVLSSATTGVLIGWNAFSNAEENVIVYLRCQGPR